MAQTLTFDILNYMINCVIFKGSSTFFLVYVEWFILTVNLLPLLKKICATLWGSIPYSHTQTYLFNCRTKLLSIVFPDSMP